MSKKHFIELADCLRASKPTGKETGLAAIGQQYRMEQWNRDVNAVAEVCKRFNPHFKEGLWFAYVNGECGPNGGRK